MKYKVLIVLFSFLPLVTWSQVRIDAATITFHKIPVMHSYGQAYFKHTAREVMTFSYNAGAMLVDSGNFCHGGSMAFQMDTVLRRLYNFRFSEYSEEDIGRNRKAWTIKSASFDEIDIYRDGDVYRGKINGDMLETVNASILEGWWREVGVAATEEDSYSSIDTAFSDSSTIEVTLYGTPLDVASNGIPGDLRLYPNPAVSTLSVVNDLHGGSLMIFDDLGRNIRTYTDLPTGINEINVVHLNSGVYWIRTATQIARFIKQ